MLTAALLLGSIAVVAGTMWLGTRREMQRTALAAEDPMLLTLHSPPAGDRLDDPLVEQLWAHVQMPGWYQSLDQASTPAAPRSLHPRQTRAARPDIIVAPCPEPAEPAPTAWADAA